MFTTKKSGMARVKAVTEKFESMVKEIEQGLIEMFEEKTTRSLDKFKELM